MNLSDRFDRKTRFLLFGGLISLLLMTGTVFFPEKGHSDPPELKKAAEFMKTSLDNLSEYCRENNININDLNDPENTGLIGQEISEITTTTGHLEAKRTTVNPNFAALIVKLLMDAGVESNNTIAIAASGSFPAILVASLSATRAMNVNPRVILSIGSSSYGATNINFTLLDIYKILLDNQLTDSKPVAVSLGGKNDIGEEFDDEIVKKIVSETESNGIPFIFEKDLQSNVLRRKDLYFTDKNIDIKAFINIGGSYANMGTSPLSLQLQPGIIRSATLPDKNSRGVIFSMLERDIPVIHLLFIKGFAQKYELTWDPVSIPEIEDDFYNFTKRGSFITIIYSIVFLACFCLFLVRYHKLKNI